MKIKLDENMPASLAEMLNALRHDVETVPQEGLAGHSDPDVWASAQREGRFLITQDLDFSNIHHFTPGTHHGLLLVRLRIPGRLALIQKISDLFESEDVLEWRRCFVVVTDSKLRIRRP
jgi:hypothetical protein